MTSHPYNPLDKRNLGKSIAEAMLASAVHPLPPEPFDGAGIYALYYVGDFAPYEKIIAKNKGNKFLAPIYVGKAIPEGARKAGVGQEGKTSRALYKRLSNHVKSISHATNLDISHFRCRYLVVDDIWIPLGESLLIEMSLPIWNMVIDGFGNNDPGSGRHAGKISAWDILHPGRPWVANLRGQNPKTRAQLIKDVQNFLANPRQLTPKEE